ncbi:sensor histidine kinase [Caldimonas sp. KR1-144]|uniref:sensor histidine kinase n=1 Tax=Caldimonas sp. KR1-144 TaxID=3400911 RepID=UPI003C03852F
MIKAADSLPPRLLVVDDEIAHMRALCDTLKAQGFDVVGCEHGEAALAALRQAPFDLLLTDLMMPGMSGIALLRRALEIDATLVVVIMTGEGTIGSAVEAMQSGALDYVLKPFKLSAMLPVISRALAVRRLRAHNAELERRVREHTAELEATNRELDAFTRSASHDLRSPLNIVLGFSALLSEELAPQLSDKHRTWLSFIDRAAHQMQELVEALMRLSRVGRKTLNVQAVDVGPLVWEVVADLRREQPKRDVTVQIGELPRVMADAPLLRQLLVNLLSNAFKYTRQSERASVEIGVEARGDELVFFVRDNGVGFDMGRAERLFDAFQRLHREDEFEGHGVGLSIVQRVVQRHGGRIWVDAAVGRGACFFFTLGPGARLPAPPTAVPAKQRLG